MIPSPMEFLVLTLGAFRICRLAGWDNFPLAARARAWATGQSHYYNSTEGGDVYRYRRPTLEHFLGCPWCVGFWISVAAYVAWVLEPRWTIYALVPWAISAVVGLVARNLDP